MRPRDQKLRERYRAAAASLLEEGVAATIGALSARLNMRFHTVRHFRSRNPDFFAEIGLPQKFRNHSLEEYQAAIDTLREQGVVRITPPRIAEALGIDRSSVTRFLKNHPELMGVTIDKRKVSRGGEYIPKPGAKRGIGIEKSVAEMPKETRLRADALLTIHRYDPHILRKVLDKVSLRQYLTLWDAKQLGFQEEGTAKPKYYPSRAEVVRALSM